MISPPLQYMCLFRSFPVLLNLSTSFLIYRHGNTRVVHDPCSFISFESGENVPGWKESRGSFSLWAYFLLLSWGIILCNIVFFFMVSHICQRKMQNEKTILILFLLGGIDYFRKLQSKRWGLYVCVCVCMRVCVCDVSSGVNQH